jgi:hypothetical protein
MYKVIELEIDPEISGDTGVFEVAWVEYPAIEQELMYFGQQKFYKAPENVSAKACRAIKENEERGNPAATQVGKVRAQQLCQRDEISLETIKRMKSYLERAAEYYTGNYDDNGTISYDLWGGKPALEWVDGILKNLEMGTQDFVKPGPAESKDDFIGRCIAYVLKEGKTPDQAAGQCYGMWENREFAATRVGFDWEVLKTPIGLKLFKNEMSKGSLPVLFIQGLPTQELIDFTRQYGIPSTAINMYDTRYEKIDLVRDMGLPRHYDLDFNVRRELGSIAIKFDYDTSALPSYENYPPSGDTDSMLVEPELPSTLYEGCGCGQGNFQDLEDACWEGYIPYGTKIKNGREVPNCVPKEDFEKFQMFPGQVGVIDGHPIFETITDAENHSIYIGCVGHHTHTTVEGNQVYMACDKHPETDYSEYTTEDFEMKKQFDFLRETLSPQEFEAITNPLLRGFTESEIYSKNHNIPTTYFQYAKVATAEGMDRDFCMSIEGRYFRRAQIDTLRDTNVEFGHQRQPYSKWLYKGGPNCIHAWIKVVFQGNNKAVMGPAEGKAGIAPKNQPFNGYYSEETRQASRRAYAISQNMSSVSYMKDIECAFGDVCKPRFDKKTEQVFAAKEEERMIYTPLMIPNILIPRIDEVSNEKYYVKFTPETIKNIRDKFMAELRNRMTNYEHTDKKFEDVVMVETWIVQGEKDKAYELGFTQEQVPFGSWMGAYKVLDTEQGNYVWNNYIKPGKVKGASVEGNFILNFSQQKGDEYLLEQVINIINQITD